MGWGDIFRSSLYDHGVLQTRRNHQRSKYREEVQEVSSGMFQYQEVKKISKN